MKKNRHAYSKKCVILLSNGSIIELQSSFNPGIIKLEYDSKNNNLWFDPNKKNTPSKNRASIFKPMRSISLKLANIINAPLK